MPSPRKLDLSQVYLKAGVQDEKLPITSVQLDSVNEEACFQLGSRLEPAFKGAINERSRVAITFRSHGLGTGLASSSATSGGLLVIIRPFGHAADGADESPARPRPGTRPAASTAASPSSRARSPS